MSKKVLIISGDGIGQEIVVQAKKALDVVNEQFDLGLEFDEALLGGAALDLNAVEPKPKNWDWSHRLPTTHTLKPWSLLHKLKLRAQTPFAWAKSCLSKAGTRINAPV